MAQGGAWGRPSNARGRTGFSQGTGPGRDFKAEDEQLRGDRREVEELCLQYGLTLPWGPYRAAPFRCFKCHERIVVYTWVGHAVRGANQPPEPRPHILKQRTTQESGGQRYWVNVCAGCGVTQGDNYLYDEEGGGGPPPFRWTWSRDVPSIPGGAAPRPQRQPPVAPTLARAMQDFMMGSGRIWRSR